LPFDARRSSLVALVLAASLLVARPGRADEAPEIAPAPPRPAPVYDVVWSRDLAIIASGGGASLFALGLPFWLPERQRVPLWAWYAGALGVAAAGTGTVLWLNPGDPYRIDNCPEESCTRNPSHLPLAPMLVTQGAGLMAVPFT
jgi:hypothetical protein